MNWKSHAIKTLISLALNEDNAQDDVTSRVLIPAGTRVEAVVVAKQAGVLCGLPLAALFFKRLSRAVTVRMRMQDGQTVRPGQAFLSFEGPARMVLSGERPVLNAIQHLSGVATFTAVQVALLGKSKTQLLDTRKTLPGWRQLEKYAVLCGGGVNHRLSLSDAVLVKENHIRICRLAKVDWVDRLRAFRSNKPAFPVQIEVQTWKDLQEALTVQPQRVLLDNLPLATLKKMIRALHHSLPNTEIEISGGVRPIDLPKLAKLGVERISMGRLTHSAPAFDCSLDILHVQDR